MKYKFTEKVIKVTKHDQDIVLEWPGGQRIYIQIRPSNADGDNYAGSLDFILPYNKCVTNWIGDDMAPAPKMMHPGKKYHPCERLAKQLVISMENNWYEKEKE